ncbi:MAG: hypothetical protein IJ550_02330 [Bacteroidaceae bacterium]|nr:hypothetical protein [Bacteroidaceae bacterium]
MRKIEAIADIEKRFEVMDWRNSYQTYVPVYFFYQDKKCFIHNRRVCGVPHGTPEAMANERNYIEQLQKNDGRFFCMYNGYKNGIDIDAFIQWIWEHGFTFTDSFKISRNEEWNYTDIHGNFNEVSCAFSYRIYDKRLAERVIRWMREWSESSSHSPHIISTS